ncbi:phage integrase family protein [Methanococcus vannielii SB]|uniref:Phage integrase family protein n=1 Tax=Methanococcus vannielii (strain ATCC 35089 / DSM 1224 / JCM 13029 / OCM 148 / SB) TaxID=406327 RepID=A6USR7_METVS|nr:site-specific integrase [Methanococcus vannielii]ABR55539.1 phage integrase family protein [Methanococcus vannielii SB]
MQNIKNLILLNPKKEEIKETPKLKKWIDKYVSEREFDGIKESTIEGDLNRLKVFLNFGYERLEKEPNDMENSDFVRFFNYLENERKLSRNTQKRYYDVLKVFYKLMRLENLNDFKNESEDRKRFSSFEIKHYDSLGADILNLILMEVLESRSTTKVRDAMIIRFLWDTGARVSEALNLKYGDSDLEKGEFRLRDTKGKEERIVTCSKDTLDFVNYCLKANIKKNPGDNLFQTYRGEPLKRNRPSDVFRNAVKELKKKGKLQDNKRVVIHSLRHGRAVDLLDKGMPIDIVKEYLGHKSIETTLYYSHSKERQQKMLNQIKKIL